jgi:hypothetical protein
LPGGRSFGDSSEVPKTVPTSINSGLEPKSELSLACSEYFDARGTAFQIKIGRTVFIHPVGETTTGKAVVLWVYIVILVSFEGGESPTPLKATTR